MIKERIRKVLVGIELTLFMVVIFFSFVKIYNECFLLKFDSFKTTIYEQRKTANPVEMTAITDRILDENHELEFLQSFYNDLTSWLYPEDFDKVERIK